MSSNLPEPQAGSESVLFVNDTIQGTTQRQRRRSASPTKRYLRAGFPQDSKGEISAKVRYAALLLTDQTRHLKHSRINKLRTSKGFKKLDVNYSTIQLGLALAVLEAASE